MKKIIAILLVLSVMFVAFGALPGNATLTLNSTVTGKLFHGFFAGSLADKAAIKDAETGTNFGDVTFATAIDMETTTVYSIGSYAFYITGNTDVVVNFSTNNRLSSNDSGVNWEAPYTLAINQIATGGPRAITVSAPATVGAAAIGEAGTTAATDTSILTTGGSGLGYKSFDLTATFIGAGNDLLPEGDYVGTIVAAVTAL